MKKYIILVLGSVTNANRLSKRFFQNYHIHTKMIHTPSELGGKGCSYSLIVTADALPKLLTTAEELHIAIKGSYLAEQDAHNDVYYHALS